jgi:hypothetical protein
VADIIYAASDNLVFLSGARNLLTGDYLTSGIVSVTGVYDSAGALVAGQDWPTAMTHIANPPDDIGLPDLQGCWYAVIDEEVALVDGQEYVAQIDAVAEGDLKARWRLRMLARERRE